MNFEFNSLMKENKVDIVASGSRKNNMAAFGAVYENANFKLDHFFMMYDDRFSPKGWYMYAIPHLEGRIEIMNCVPYPYCPKVKELFFKALKKRKFLMNVVKAVDSVTCEVRDSRAQVL